MPLLHDMNFLCLRFSVFLKLRGAFFLCQLPLYKLVYVTWRFPCNKDFWWSFSFSDMLTAGIATSWTLAKNWFLERFFSLGKTKSDPSHITVCVTCPQVDVAGELLRPGFDWDWLSGFKLNLLSCVYVYVGMPSTWPGVQGTRAPYTRTRGLSTGSAAGPKGAHSPMT